MPVVGPHDSSADGSVNDDCSSLPPERWQRISHEGAVAEQLGSYRELFHNPRLRKHALAGLLLGCSGVVGLWAVVALGLAALLPQAASVRETSVLKLRLVVSMQD